ncbi:MAG: hypothetical protein ABSG90_06675 [Dehalococcoidia bacterium]|jgi:uncharacterized membrane protein YozB (DUF420 family)
MEKTWKTLTAGILDIISGIGMMFVCFWMVVAGSIAGIVHNVPQWVPGLLFALAILMIIVAIVAVVGGIFAIKRRVWGMALAGSIAAFFCCFIFGVISIVLTTLGHSEFK